MTYVRTKDGRVFIPDKKTFKAVGVNSVPKLTAYWYSGEPFTVDEIIKEKQVNVKVLVYCFRTGEDYNCLIDDTKRELTQEEYELLKEVLL